MFGIDKPLKWHCTLVENITFYTRKLSQGIPFRKLSYSIKPKNYQIQ